MMVSCAALCAASEWNGLCRAPLQAGKALLATMLPAWLLIDELNILYRAYLHAGLASRASVLRKKTDIHQLYVFDGCLFMLS